MRVSRLTWLVVVIAALILLSTAGQILGLYTDWLWFREVQFTSVFVTVLRTEILVGVVTGVAFFVILYGNVALARRLAPRAVLVVADDALGLPSPDILRPYLRRLDPAREHDAGSPRRLAGDGPMGAGPEGAASHAVRHSRPALRPGGGLLRVPASALELPLWLADGGPHPLWSGHHRRVLLPPGAFRSRPVVSRSPDGPGATSWSWRPSCSS